MRFDIAIPTYCGAGRVETCLRTLREHTPAETIGTITVSCDNGDTPERQAESDRHYALLEPICELYGALLVRPAGWGYMARNWTRAVLGGQGTVADWVLLCNDDIEFTPDIWPWVERALTKDVGAASLALTEPERDLTLNPGAGFVELLYRPWGPCFFMRRELFDVHGGFSEEAQLLEEEVGEWVWQAGLICLHIGLPNPVIHRHNSAHRMGIDFGDRQQGGPKSAAAWERLYGYPHADREKVWSERLAHVMVDLCPDNRCILGTSAHG